MTVMFKKGVAQRRFFLCQTVEEPWICLILTDSSNDERSWQASELSCVRWVGVKNETALHFPYLPYLQAHDHTQLLIRFQRANGHLAWHLHDLHLQHKSNTYIY